MGNEAGCRQTGGKCLWSSKQMLCHARRHGGKGKKPGKPEWKDACTGFDEEQCAVQTYMGNCSWSAEKKVCYEFLRVDIAEWSENISSNSSMQEWWNDNAFGDGNFSNG